MGDISLTKNPQSKDDSLEALDFIVNVLKEHERDLDKLINELATVTEQLGDTGEISGKVEKVEEKINNLQKEVTNLIGYVSGNAHQKKHFRSNRSSANRSQAQTTAASAPTVQGRPNVILRCKQWEDFQTLAFRHKPCLSAIRKMRRFSKQMPLRATKLSLIVVHFQSFRLFSRHHCLSNWMFLKRIFWKAY